ncbi:hypothetical protein GCM10022254_46240 [Actinomadura meridiana]|uniref:Urease accessory protein UreD n=1 Tax=Actinomadura meridiana TaxID=559626 RepID=A0ABP8CA77_9ACTN
MLTRTMTPDALPVEVAGHASVPDTLPVGSPGKDGVLELAFRSVDGRTELTSQFQKAPLHITRPLYLDGDRPGMPCVMFMSSGGGILQGDRYRMRLDCGSGTSVRFTTQTATRLYRMEHDYAVQTVELDVGEGSYVEYLPEPTIPFTDSRFYQRMAVTVGPNTTVLLGDRVMAGRLARGERHAYTAYCTDLDVQDTQGRLLFADPLRFVPAERTPAGPTAMDDAGTMASLYVVSQARPARELADALHEALTGTGVRGGAGVLPGDHGAWARMLGGESPETDATFSRALDVARRLVAAD